MYSFLVYAVVRGYENFKKTIRKIAFAINLFWNFDIFCRSGANLIAQMEFYSALSNDETVNGLRF